MATYKKKGYKKEKKNVEELDYLVKDGESTTAEVFSSLDESASKIELFIEKNQKWIFAGLIAIIVAVGAYMLYDSNIKKPHEQDAVNNLVKAQEFFDKAINEKDDKIALENFDKALNGADGKYGFKQVSEKFSGTKAGNLSNYYMGMIYLKKGDFKDAVSYLSKFEGNDDILKPTALGSIGDAFLELEQNADALTYYEKAAKASDNVFTTPKYYLKAGKLALETGDKAKAKAFFTIIKDKYGKSKEAKDIDIYIAQAE
jgi:TolA-binding protein